MQQVWTLLTVLIPLSTGMGIYIDLTHQLGANNPIWPGDPPFSFNIVYREQFEDYWYELNSFSTSEHMGTHIDAPAHFSRGKWRVDQIPVEHLIGPGVIIDITERARNDPDAQVQVDDLLKWELKHGRIPNRAIVLMNSGWGSKWPNPMEVFGSSNINDSATFHFPGFSPHAVKWLADNRKDINAIGVDTPSIDFGQSTDFVSHITALGASILAFENVANVDKLPPFGSMIFGLPIKLFDGSGSPARIVAVLPGITSSASLFSNNLNSLFTVAIFSLLALNSIKQTQII